VLTAAAIAAADPGPVGSDLSVVECTGSTNDDLVRAARLGAPAGRTLVAEEQTRGRGRLGHAWHSPAGTNLHLSVLLRPSRVEIESVPVLALVAGVAVAEAVMETAALPARLKWPNDVLIDGRKVSGILAEIADTSPLALVVGVGINVNVRFFPPDLESIATSIFRETDRDTDRAVLAAAMLRGMHRRFEEAEQGGLASVLERWRTLSSTIGRIVRTADGVEGRAVDVDPTGALLVTDASGEIHSVVGGQIREIG
jgi:BirA family biotin operon repressor/biotin-[acetyl-CoA-carboxylase] ligase